jgi:hypothetical protein
MLNDKTVRGSNFTCFHAGPKEGRAQFRPEPPDAPPPARGKLFLRSLLGSARVDGGRHLDGHEPAIDHHRMSRDIGGGVRTQPDDRLGHLGGRPPPPHRL